MFAVVVVSCQPFLTANICVTNYSNDCIIPIRRSVFSRSAFSVTASEERTLLPVQIRQINTYCSLNGQLKLRLVKNQTCS